MICLDSEITVIQDFQVRVYKRKKESNWLLRRYIKV